MPENARDKEQQASFFEFLYKRSQMLHGFEDELAGALEGVSFFRDQEMPATVEAAADQLYAYHWNYFEQSAEIKLAGGQFNAICGLGAWVRYELALALKHASDIGTCAGCGQPFYIKHAKQTVCDPDVSRCRTQAKRRRDSA